MAFCNSCGTTIQPAEDQPSGSSLSVPNSSLYRDEQVIFVLQAGNTTHEQVLRSIDLIGEKVLPRFEVKAHAAALQDAAQIGISME